MRIFSPFPVARLADVVALSEGPVAHGAEPRRSRLSRRALDVSSHCLVVRLVERVQLSLQPRDVALGLLVVHSELDLADLVAQIPQLLLPYVAILPCQVIAAADPSCNNISCSRQKNRAANSFCGYFSMQN
jgi:hypothetical protein